MPARQELPPSGQESLIINDVTTGEVYARDFDTEFPAVSLIEHNLQQLNALNMFAKIHEKEWMIRHPEYIKKRYPKNHEAVLSTVAEDRKKFEESAESEFKRSLGYFAVVESGQVEDIKPYNQDANRRWTRFSARYRSLSKTGARLAETERLIEELGELNQRKQTIDNRAQGLRPHAPDKAVVRRSKADAEPVERTLTTRERLEAIFDDPRAGFLPANNDEKNKVLTYLDYLDNPEYPLGINNQLFEVFIHQQRLKDKPNGLELARQAMVSITYEMGDHLLNATQSLKDLSDLQEIVDDCPNPRVPLTEIAGPTHPGFGALIRYRDLKQLRENGKLPAVTKDPLRVKEDRRPHVEPEKNKTLEDTYTQEVRSAVMNAYIEGEAAGYTVGKVRMLVKQAIADQKKRQAFMADRLGDLRLAPDARNLPMWPVAQRILEHLELDRTVQ